MPERKNVNPKDQFSKWLAKSGAIYWIFFHTLLAVLMYLRPEVANACVYLSIIISIVMIIHVWAYTRNSIYEKGLLAMLDKVKMELSLGKIAKRKENDYVEVGNDVIDSDIEDETEYHEEEE